MLARTEIHHSRCIRCRLVGILAVTHHKEVLLPVAVELDRYFTDVERRKSEFYGMVVDSLRLDAQIGRTNDTLPEGFAIVHTHSNGTGELIFEKCNRHGIPERLGVVPVVPDLLVLVIIRDKGLIHPRLIPLTVLKDAYSVFRSTICVVMCT